MSSRDYIVPVNISFLSFRVFYSGLIFLGSIAILLNVEIIMHYYLRIAAMVISFLGMAFFSYVLLINIIYLIKKPNVIRVSDDGIMFNASVLNNGLIEWDNVREYKLVKVGFSKYILITLNEPDLFVNNASGLTKRLFRTNLKKFKTPVAITSSLIPGDVADTLKRISNWKNNTN